MSALRSTVLTVLSMALVVGVSTTILAQEADPMEPSAVLGWALDETHVADGESGELGDRWVREGVSYAYRFDASDDRLEGEAVWTGHGFRYATEPMFEVQSNTWVITTDSGDGWDGTSTALVGNGLGDTEAIVLEGTGAYEGLSAYLVMHWTRAGGSFRGAIFPDPMPETP